jgi:acyl-coenzyme A synthetase/AMP-(fatty) acid ligase
LYPPKNLGLLFDWHAAKSRQTQLVLDRPFDISPTAGTEFDGISLARLVENASAWLYAAGLREGGRLGVIKKNHFDMILLSAAAARIGAVAATISGANQPHHMQEMLSKLKPQLLLIESDILASAALGGFDLSTFCRTVLIDAPIGSNQAGLASLRDFEGAPVPVVNVQPDDAPMMITHTSGTTSTPKLVVHSANSNRAGTRLELLPLPFAINKVTDTALSSISFAHSRAYTWTAAQFYWAPAKLVVLSSHSASDAERMFETHRPTTVESLPNVFQHWLPLVRRRPELFSQVRYYLNTFDMNHPSIVRPFLEASRHANAMWALSWGQSEVGPIAGAPFSLRKINRLALDPSKNHMNALGIPWPGLIRAKVVDPDTGRKCQPGQVGVILVKSRSLCLDYIGESDRYWAKRTGSWWNTGDVGFMDRLGRVHFIDRAVDEVPGASATEIESVLLDRIPRAVEVVILTRGASEPQPVVCTADNILTDAEWREASVGLPEMAPPVLVSWDSLPRTSTWKVRRKELRESVFSTEIDNTVLEERFT